MLPLHHHSPTWRRRGSLRRLLALALLLAARPAAMEGQAADTARKPIPIDSFTVFGKRPVTVGPMRGLQLTRDQVAANIQSASGVEIRKSQALSLNQFLNEHLQGVSVNDYQGNPFQMDVTYRGFSASPQIGTPQGLSVFVDGTRVNEPFGDVVNWDMIPLNAIGGLDLYSGSNPLFGLNTLGGALALRTRGGFTDHGVEVEALAGNWGRTQVQAAAGGSKGALAGFVAGTWFEESGWRDDSKSSVKQAFGRVDWAPGFGVLTGAVLLARNDLIGNGLIPLTMFQVRPEDVFSSPDQTRNQLTQFSLDGLFPLGQRTNITAHLYRRDSNRQGVNGDIYEDFEDFDRTHDAVYSAKPDSQRYCRYADLDHDGVPDGQQPTGFDPIFGNPNCYRGGTLIGARNGANGGFSHTSGMVDGTPIGLRTDTELDQLTHGAAAQFNWNGDQHHFMAGASIDASSASYVMGQQLGLLDGGRQIQLDPSTIDSVYRAAQVPIHGNDFSGKDRTASLYLNETWSIRSNLHLTLAARFNAARVHNQMDARGDEGNVDLSELKNKVGKYILCPTDDPASCPDAPTPVIKDVSSDSIAPSEESHDYESFNPSIGLTWQPKKGLSLYASLSRGARSPSSIELGCAFDGSPVLINPDIPVWGHQPRSLAGPACTLPTTLSGDPYLPQIRSTSFEVGAHGTIGPPWEWNSSLYRTDLSNDIYFVGVGGGRSYFDDVGDTRRQGLELGLKGTIGPLSLTTAYSYTDASFMSQFWMLSPHNSSADFDQNSRRVFGVGDEVGQFGHRTLHTPGFDDNRGYGTYLMIRVDPGARIPGVPLHNLNLGADVQVTRSLMVGANMVARSSSYLRGNENNLHEAKGTDQQTGQYYCPTFQIEDPDCYGGYLQAPVPVGRTFTENGTVPGYAVFNLHLGLKLWHNFSLSALLNNVFDKTYYSAGRLGVNPFAPSTIGAIGPSGWNYNSSEWQNATLVGPGGPRGIWVTLSFAMGRSADAE
jgi:outer membrane receptor protein involved in Fe transport